VDRRRKAGEQYFVNITSLVESGEPSVVVDGFVITANDIWSMFPSIPLQDLPTCKGTTSLCMTKNISYMPSDWDLSTYYKYGTYGEYLGPRPNTATALYYLAVTPANDTDRSVRWTAPYHYQYANLIR
jgi:hypothetical protein